MKHLKTYQLAVQFFRVVKTKQLPCPIADQLTRAASSVVLNIAEGLGRATRKDQLRFLNIALASLREVQAIAEIYSEYFSTAEHDLLDHTAATLFKFIRRMGA